MALQLRLAFAMLAVALPVTLSHRPLLAGTAGPSQFATWKTALAVPWLTNSWATNWVSDCQHQQFWMKVTSLKPKSEVYVGAGLGDAKGLQGMLLNAVLFGPGLKGKSKVAGAPKGMGSLNLLGPTNISSCGFLQSETSKSAYTVHEGRCAYLEVFSRSWLYSLMDLNVTLPQAGTYYIMIRPQRQAAGRFYVATGDWPQSEEFTKPYKMPLGTYMGKYGDANATLTCCSKDDGASSKPLLAAKEFSACKAVKL